MSITDELRAMLNMTESINSADIQDLYEIADRIDEQHRRALEKFAAMVDGPLADGPREKDSAVSDRIEELERRVCVITENLDWALRFMDQTEKRVSVLERKLNHRGDR